MKKLANITDRLFGQPMFKILSIAQQMEREGKRVIHFEIGDPNFDPPKIAIEAVIKAIQDGKNHYTNSMGLQELRSAIADYTERDLGFRPEIEQILVCPANAIIDFCVRCVANPGEQVLIPDPGFPTYRSVLDYNNIEPIGIPLLEINNFKMQSKDVQERITDRTRLIILNSPQNPTGAVMDESDVLEIVKIAEENDLFILSDEVYSKLIFDSIHFSPTVVDRCKERTILLKSFSKTYSMSGWRIGYAIGPVKVIEKMGLMLQTILSCLPAFTQIGAMAALNDSLYTRNCLAELKIRRDLFVTGLNQINGIRCLEPKGAFYLFPFIEHTGMSSFEYCQRILVEEGLCMLPGSSFGDCASGHMRLSFSNVTLTMISEALEKFDCFHKRHF